MKIKLFGCRLIIGKEKVTDCDDVPEGHLKRHKTAMFIINNYSISDYYIKRIHIIKAIRLMHFKKYSTRVSLKEAIQFLNNFSEFDIVREHFQGVTK